jgi:hypothetical protein
VLAQTAVTVPTSRVPLTGGGISAATNVGSGNTATAAVTGSPNTRGPANTNGPVIVTATPSPTSGAVRANKWNGMLVGVVAVAISAVFTL